MPHVRIFPNKATTFHGIHRVFRLTGCSKKNCTFQDFEMLRDLKKAASQATVPFNVIFPFNL